MAHDGSKAPAGIVLLSFQWLNLFHVISPLSDLCCQNISLFSWNEVFKTHKVFQNLSTGSRGIADVRSQPGSKVKIQHNKNIALYNVFFTNITENDVSQICCNEMKFSNTQKVFQYPST